jgi:predicted nucleotidyltransferase component of viral defense system
MGFRKTLGGKTLSLSRSDCEKIASSGGFQPESVEKVSYLLTALTAINTDEYLSNRLVLKGGTALNLFHFSMPRLSVDIDLNYVGSIDARNLDKERTEIENRLKRVCKPVGINLQTGSQDYANRGYKGLYRSNFVRNSQIKIDVNYLHRVCLWAPQRLDSFRLGKEQAVNISVISLYELAAGKLCALLARSASRDLFDVQELSTAVPNTDKKLRLAYLFYAAKQPKDWSGVSLQDVRLKESDVESELFPMLSANVVASLGSPEECANRLIAACKSYVEPLTKLSTDELEYIRLIRVEGKIDGSLLTDDSTLQSKINVDPATLYRCSKAIIKTNPTTPAPTQKEILSVRAKQWDPNNVSERMLNALSSLACSKDSLQNRLENAAITLMALQARDFPEPVRREFDQIFVQLTDTKDKEAPEGALHQAINSFDDNEASELIERIVYFCYETWKRLAE